MINIESITLSDKAQVDKLSSHNIYNYKTPIPTEYLPGYIKSIAKFSKNYDFLAEDFHSIYRRPPYNWEDFLYFVDRNIGFGVTVKFFENRTDKKISGAWHWDNKEMTSFTIYVNQSEPPKRQKMTIIHECIHAIQDFDNEFKEMLAIYPVQIQRRIADRIAEKAAAQIILPREDVILDQIIDGLNPYQIAIKYDVSLQMASFI